MAHLPPVGWADVATKQDLETLRIATKADLERGLRRQTMWFSASVGVLFTLNTSLWVGTMVWLGQRLPTS